MGTQVLYPHDCLNRRLGGFAPTFRRNFSRPSHHRKPIRKRSPEPPFSKKSASSDDLRQKPIHKYVNHKNQPQVTILKRGESLDLNMYAGSAFSVSPSPSSLPLPSFTSKKNNTDDSATRDLRRLLGLN